jgi:hypothetical protein
MKVQLIRQYSQLNQTYSLIDTTTGKEYIVNIVTRETKNHGHRPISISITLDGFEVEDEDERELVLKNLQK